MWRGLYRRSVRVSYAESMTASKLRLTAQKRSRNYRSLPPGRTVGKSSECEGTALRLNPDVVVHGSVDPLFTSEVSLCSLNRRMSEKELDLLQFATADVTELRA